MVERAPDNSTWTNLMDQWRRDMIPYPTPMTTTETQQDEKSHCDQGETSQGEKNLYKQNSIRNWNTSL